MTVTSRFVENVSALKEHL